jgi:hypothetical protein
MRDAERSFGLRSRVPADVGRARPQHGPEKRRNEAYESHDDKNEIKHIAFGHRQNLHTTKKRARRAKVE